MKYLSVCSGIEAATVAWHPLGWEAVAYSEIEKFPSEVLAHHYPNVPNVGDMTKFKEWNLGSIDLLVGGTPCQSFSVAGLRKGLDDPRGNLMLTYLAIADKYRPNWLVWENVPGVLSSNEGRDFGTFLGGLGELGYGFSYRVLDAQYFGVAQRRRRVFVVGHIGDWRPSAAVLFERESLFGNPAPSRKSRQESSQSFEGSSAVGSLCARTGLSTSVQDAEQNHLLPTYGIPGNWINRKPENGGNAVEPMNNISPCLTKTDQHGVVHPIAFDAYNHTIQGDVNQPLRVSSAPGQIDAVGGIIQNMNVRKLTPKECERLQGFPDGYTDIKPKGKDTPDGARYKALGNSMAVPVMRWIGERIQKFEKEMK